MNPILNCDLGETDTPEGLQRELRLLGYVDVANIACGAHAGSPLVMETLLKACLNQGKKAGAHPSYPDREGFGRRTVPASPRQISLWVAGQIRLLADIADRCGIVLHHVKPHGALYNDAQMNAEIAGAVIDGVLETGLKPVIIGLPGSKLEDAVSRAGLAYWAEAFADRRYQPDGTLMPRNLAGSVLSAVEAAAQVHRLISGGHVLTSAGAVPVIFDTLCVHGDGPDAEEIVKGIIWAKQ